jgi:2,4-dienoyl-CoA reductase-like NADH-dependent reductase (Old Yellow Enzyme family)
MSARVVRVSSLKTAAGLRAHLARLGLALPCDDAVLPAPQSPLAAPLALAPGLVCPNRFAIHPMEGWDAGADGAPGPLTVRRWQRFGASGAGWIWGGEAAAVREDGRANPNQLLMNEATASAIGALRRALLASAHEAGHPAPVVGLQLTHSGRWSRPHGGPAPRIAFRHPVLDRRVGATEASVLSDAEVEALVRDFARAARLAQAEGFDFVDLKHCHGYLLHEFLAARSRPGAFGGESLAARTRLLRALAGAVRDAAPGLALGIRLSVFDLVPFTAGADGAGVPEAHARPYRFAFGADPDDPARPDLGEACALAAELSSIGVTMLNVTGGSPYYVPHAQRPAAFPPSDGYGPPEDPLAGVVRLLEAARALKRAAPGLAVVSTGWTYLQEFLPAVAQACVREGWFDAVGLGRMALSAPELPARALAGALPERGRICRTFSDCTTAPRSGLVSGCYPLDAFYRARPEHAALERAKRARRSAAEASR